MAFDLKALLIGMVIPMVLKEGAKAAETELDKIAVSEPEWHKTAVVCGHRLIGTHLDEVIENTPNEYDDAVLAEVVIVLENQAEKHGYVLIS